MQRVFNIINRERILRSRGQQQIARHSEFGDWHRGGERRDRAQLDGLASERSGPCPNFLRIGLSIAIAILRVQTSAENAFGQVVQSVAVLLRARSILERRGWNARDQPALRRAE